MQSVMLLLNRRFKIHKMLTKNYARDLSSFKSSCTNCSKMRVSIATQVLNQFTTQHSRQPFCSSPTDSQPLDDNTFEKVCDETLDSLTEYIEELLENAPYLKSADISYSSGVLTVTLGDLYGTYVINRQSPNKQIWLSSPISGPKRYDFIPNEEYWVYKHDGQSLHQLLQNELSSIIREKVDFSRCSYSNLPKK